MFKLDFVEKKIGDLNFKTYKQEVLKGEIVALYGENNSGKTLLLEMLAGYHQPSKGSLELNGVKSIHQRSYSCKIGYVSSEDDLYEDFKVIEQINLVKAGNKKNKETLLSSYYWFNQFFNLTDLENLKVGSLSKSQKQILKLFLAIVNSPSLLLLDDFFEYFSTENYQKVIIFLKKLQERKIVLIFSIRSLSFLQNLAKQDFISKYFYLEKGELKRSFKPDYLGKYALKRALSEDEAFRELFSRGILSNAGGEF